MNSFDDRKKALEEKFFHDEEFAFKIKARTRKLLGLWAAGCMHVSEEESLEYALGIVKLGIEDSSDGAIIMKLFQDMKEAGAEVTEEKIREEIVILEKVALEQFIEEHA